MDAVHVMSTGLITGAFAAVTVGGRRADLALGGRTGRLLTLLVVGALVLGNLVSLLPGAPRWYSLAVTALTAAAAVWLASRYIRTRVADPAITVVGAPAARATAPRPARPGRLAPVPAPLYAATDTGPVDAEVVDDAALAPVVSIVRDHAVTTVTADDLHALGPVGSRTTVGSAVYVAADIAHYTRQRAARGEFGRRRHGVPATADDADRRLRVLRAYGASASLRGRLHDERA